MDRTTPLDIIEETETRGGWRYRIASVGSESSPEEFVLTMSWRDHEFVAGGSVPPSELAAAVAEVLMQSRGGASGGADGAAQSGETIDLATAMRQYPGFVEEVRARLAR